ncbi:MAG TPA: hypothetical protein VHX44_02025 [Planctomycetota bacterium]|nr:hypothetical protein [Planctomycetota bacterium]
MPSAPRLLPLIVILCLLITGCGDEVRAKIAPTPEEQALIGQITRDPYVEVLDLERNDLEHLVVTTRQGSQRVRYELKPARPGEAALMVHKINDRSVVEISESDQLGTGPQVGPHGRYR